MGTKYKVDGELFDSEQEAEEYCYEQEIIYYYNAIKYLAEHDPSLVESLELACDMGYLTPTTYTTDSGNPKNVLGYNINNLNSELLATLLYQQELLNSIEEVE